MLSKLLSKPVYAHRPDQIVRRLANRRSTPASVRLPWGGRLEVDPREAVGSGIARTGVHELAVTEAMWRLAEATDLALDVGANIGYFTALLAERCREVWAFEPHPTIGDRLVTNVATRDRVAVHRVAVSDKKGTAHLSVPEWFDTNTGTAALTLAGDGVEVPTVTLDDMLGARRAGVLKIDIEGHEFSALKGAERALSEHRIRDVIFEDQDEWPTPVADLLVNHGYTLFGLQERFRGVDLCAPDVASIRWAAPTFVASCNPRRATDLMERAGWHSLRPR